MEDAGEGELHRSPNCRRSLIASGIEEGFDLSPILPDDVICADVPAALERLEFFACDLSKFLGSGVGHIRIIFGMKHQHLGTIDFVSVVPRVVERAAAELAPVRVREPIGIPECFADVLRVVLF